MIGMEKPSHLLVDSAQSPEAAPCRNRGWFRPGDSRINRRGRPTRIGALARQAKVGQPLSGRFVRVFVPESIVCRFLANWKTPHPPVPDPRYFCIVATEFDAQRGGVVFTLHSKSYPHVGAGQIPEVPANWFGTGWWRTM